MFFPVAAHAAMEQDGLCPSGLLEMSDCVLLKTDALSSRRRPVLGVLLQDSLMPCSVYLLQLIKVCHLLQAAGWLYLASQAH